jgi:hypothetical protein
MIIITKKQNFHSSYEISTDENKYVIQSGEYCELSESVNEVVIKLNFNTYVINVRNASDAIILVENKNVTNLLKIRGIKCDLDIYHEKSFLSYLGSAITIIAYSFLLLLLLIFPILYFLMILSN